MPRTVIRTQAQPAVEMYLAGDMRAWCWPGLAKVEVPSASTPGGRYTVTVTDTAVQCECKGFSYRGACRHVARVRSLIRLGKDQPCTSS